MAHRGRVPADDALAAALAAGRTVADAARAAGVSERTAHRRNAHPRFRALVADLRGRMVAAAAGQLADALGAAAGVLRDLLAHPDADVRHKAAVKLIELGVRVAEHAELRGRLEAVEARLLAHAAADRRGG